MPLDPQTRILLDFIAATGRPSIEQGTPEEGRAGMRAMTVDLVQPDQIVQVGAVEEAKVDGAEGALAARIYRPLGSDPATDPRPTVVYLHGGGFVIGDLDTHDQSCRRLCHDTDAVVLSVDYRLAPEDPFPAAPLDAIAATRWAAANIRDLGGNDVLAVAGDSAGGNLAAVVAQRLGDAISAQLLIYPAADGVGDYPSYAENAEGYFLTLPMLEWFRTNYVPEGADLSDIALVAPLQGDVSGVCPAIVVTAEFDPLRDEGEAYAAKLREAGVPVDAVRYDGLVHGFQEMALMSTAADRAVADMFARFKKLLHPA
jgi:acetyl esterase